MLRLSTWIKIVVWCVDQSMVALEDAADMARRWGW
jgi:hypothetical protein